MTYRFVPVQEPRVREPNKVLRYVVTHKMTVFLWALTLVILFTLGPVSAGIWLFVLFLVKTARRNKRKRKGVTVYIDPRNPYDNV